jgi:hypothetical protein
MLSRDIEAVAEWVAGNIGDARVRCLLITQLNGLAAAAHALESQVVPFHARSVVETANVVCLARRRPARPPGER